MGQSTQIMAFWMCRASQVGYALDLPVSMVLFRQKRKACFSLPSLIGRSISALRYDFEPATRPIRPRVTPTFQFSAAVASA